MNRLVLPFLELHKKEYELKDDDSSNFEHLINYITVRNYTSRHFDPYDVSLGKGEVGIDGVAVIINDTLVTELVQVQEIFENTSEINEISVAIIFVQSKTSTSFDLEALSHFFTATNDFLNDANIKMNDKSLEMHNICKYIMEHPTRLVRNPDIHMFFAFTGVESENQQRDAVVDNQIEALKKMSMFDEVTFALYDAPKIVSICRAIKSSIKKTIDMIDCAVIPKIHNVSEAYIGIVKCKDYVSLISNYDGAIISNLFEDNVRYFQGQNNVNAEMQATLRVVEKQQEFSILNNGVTIVASEIRRTGNSFTLTNFQVINGCQTSFILYENRKRIDENAYVVVKLIATTDKDISDSIVKTTNRQTPVLNEAFETLRDFHKKLEVAYDSYPLDYKLYYERRSKQYDASDVNKNKIVSFPFQTKAYVAVFLSEPHSTHRYYGELLKSYSKKMYNDSDVLEQYCIASIIVYLVDKFIRDNPDYVEFKIYKFHIALLLRCLVSSEQNIPIPNSKDMQKLCDKLFSKIKNKTWLENNIKYSCNVIKNAINEQRKFPKNKNNLTRSKEFTSYIIEKCIGKHKIQSYETPQLKKGSRVKCKVTGWNSSYAYVELLDYKDIGSIYIKNIAKHYIWDIGEELSINQIIEAVIIDDNPHVNFGYGLSMIK